MPIINVQLLDDITNEQKAEVIKSITNVMVNVLGKEPSSTFVVIQEVSPNNWGFCGETVAIRRENKNREKENKKQ